MLLFHGTRVEPATLDRIFTEGLRATSRAWTHTVTGEPRTCFVSTQPVASILGDPVHFAMGKRYTPSWRQRTDGWIVVLDLPKSAVDRVVAALPNLDLEQYFLAQRFQRELLCRALVRMADGAPPPPKSRGPWTLEVLLALGRDNAAADAFADARGECLATTHDVHATGITFEAWSRYSDALRGARTLAEVVRAGRKYGVKWDRPEVPHCALCVQALANWGYRVSGDPVGAATFLPAVVNGRPIAPADWVVLARQIAGWFDGVDPARVRAALETLPKHDATWEQAFARLPLDPTRVPAPWRPDFGRTWTEADLRRPDVQLVCRDLGAEFVRGAIKLASGPRMLPWVRPRRGETLAAKLWSAAHTVVDRYRGEPVRYEGE